MDQKDFSNAQAKMWQGALKSYEIEELTSLMKTGPVKSAVVLYGGESKPLKVTLEHGIVGVFKVGRTGDDFWSGTYKAEIAAYQIDQALGLNMVPLTILRPVTEDLKKYISGGDAQSEGSLQLWVDGVVEGDAEKLPNDARFFDKLIGNSDRLTKGNFAFLSSGQPVLYDNACSFLASLSSPYGKVNPTKEGILAKAKLFNKESLEPILKPLSNFYNQDAVDGFIKRRDTLLKAIAENLD